MDSTLVKSGVDLLTVAASLGVASFLAGVVMMLSRNYRIQSYVGWITCIVGAELLTLFAKNSTASVVICLPIFVATGVGIVFATTERPVLASLSVSDQTNALTLCTFVHSFGVVSYMLSGHEIIH